VPSAEALLAAPPAPPLAPERFDPALYPDTPPMVPASGPPLGDLDDALAALHGTIAEPLAVAYAAGEAACSSLAYGIPASPGRVIGAPEDGPPGARVVNERYRSEAPELLVLSLAHTLLWDPAHESQCQEATLHALGAMAFVQVLARRPELASTGTELARRQCSLALTLLNSRRPGSAGIALIAPAGPGTIPGGAPDRQTPDFWSVPFRPDGPRTSDAPPLLAAVLDLLVDDAAPPPSPLRFDDALGTFLTEHLGRRWLPVDAQLRAAIALGLVVPPSP
jgi:hypothetical protein